VKELGSRKRCLHPAFAPDLAPQSPKGKLGMAARSQVQ
jgi:hypothetical protein